ncbi:MAG: hypothetical protein E7337_02240 [Clostridiales bacterium]|nr:hypothetical protein [Clostridiales bacterium]
MLVKKLRRTACKIGRGGVNVAPAADFSEEKSHFAKEKSQPCRFHDRNSFRIQVKSGGRFDPRRGSKSALPTATAQIKDLRCGTVVVAGELAPSSTSLAKRLF